MTQDITHKHPGWDRILPWLFIADRDASVIVNKDSSLLAAWKFSGVDIESGDSDTIDDVAMSIDMTLRGISEDKPIIWTRMDRRRVSEYPYGNFTNPLCEAIDRHWGANFTAGELFENNHHIAVAMPVIGGSMSVGEMTRGGIDAGMNPPMALLSALKNRLIGGRKKFGFLTREDLDVMLNRFQQLLCAPLDNGSMGIDAERLKGPALLGFLKSTVSASNIHPVAVDHGVFLDSYLSDSFLDNRFEDYLILSGANKKFIATYSLKKAPRADINQALHVLTAMPVELSVLNCWKALTQKESESFLSSARTFDEIRTMRVKKLLSRMMSGVEVQDDGAPKTRTGGIAMALAEEVKEKNASFGWLTSSIAVYAESEEALKISCELVQRELDRCSLVYIRERDGNMSAFCGGIPGQRTEPVRWYFTEASTLTDMSPLVTLSAGVNHHPYFSKGKPAPVPPNAVFKTRYGTPHNFNYHNGELGHALLVGPSRNGKTMLQSFLETQFNKYENARIFNIDKDYSLMPQTYLMGGDYIDLNPDRLKVKLNPVSLATDDFGRAWLVGWLDRLMGHRGDRLSDEEITLVADAVRNVASMEGARLSTLATQLPSHLKARLSPWLEGGVWGVFFDNPLDDFTLSRMTTVEVGSLINAGMTDVIRAFTDYAFFRIERGLQNRAQEEMGPTMIYFEEAGFLLDDPIFANKARDYLMTLAKKMAFLVMTAQSPEPFVNNPLLAAAVRDNVPTVIFMPNTKAVSPELAIKYKSVFGLNDNHLALIAGAQSRAEYCLWHQHTGMFRIVRAQFPPEIVAALRSDSTTQAIFSRIYDPKDPSWKQRYLEVVQEV